MKIKDLLRNGHEFDLKAFEKMQEEILLLLQSYNESGRLRERGPYVSFISEKKHC